MLVAVSVVGTSHLAVGLTTGPAVVEIKELIGARHHSGPLEFSPNGEDPALPKRNGGKVEVWDVATRKMRVLVSSFNKDAAAADGVAFSNDSRLLAVLYRDPGITVWDLAANKEQAHIPFALPSWANSMAFTDDNRTLVTIVPTVTDEDREAERMNCVAIRWDVSTGKKQGVHVFEPTLRIKALSRNGRYAVLQLGDIRQPEPFDFRQLVYDLATGKKIFAFDGYGGFVFTDDSSALATYNSDQACLWAVPSGRQLRHFAIQASPQYFKRRCKRVLPIDLPR